MSVGDDFHGSERAAERYTAEEVAKLDKYREGCARQEQWQAERLRIRTALLQEWMCDNAVPADIENKSCGCISCRTRRELAKDKESPQA